MGLTSFKRRGLSWHSHHFANIPEGLGWVGEGWLKLFHIL
jgi:hypothetical protein